MTDVKVLRSGNLLFHFGHDGSIEVRDRETLTVLTANKGAGDMYSMSSRCALALVSDTYGMLRGLREGWNPYYEFFRGDGLEPITFTPSPELGKPMDLAYSATEKQFLLFYESGWVETRSPWDLAVSDSFRLTTEITCAALSHDGRTIAIIENQRALLFSAPAQRVIFSLPGSLYDKRGLMFSPSGNALFDRHRNAEADRSAIWWSAPRAE